MSKEAIKKLEEYVAHGRYAGNIDKIKDVIVLLRADQATAGPAQTSPNLSLAGGMREPETSEIKETINKIQGALGDPNAPWYGSDLVPWVADLVEDYNRLVFKLKELSNAVQINCNPPEDCNDSVVLKKYMKACFDKALRVQEYPK